MNNETSQPENWEADFHELIFGDESGALTLEEGNCECHLDDERVKDFIRTQLTRAHSTGFAEGKEEGHKEWEDLNKMFLSRKEAYSAGFDAGIEAAEKLIEKHDPRGAHANPAYWGKTLRAALSDLKQKSV